MSSLVQHSDYRSFLRAVFADKKRVNSRFSFRRFAEVVGFKSPNYLQTILEGRRGLSNEMGAQIAEKLKFTPHQRDYFLSLIKLDTATTESERNSAERARLLALKKIVSKEIPDAQREVLSRWYHLLVRELFLLPKARPDAKWISGMLAQCIDAKQAEQSLDYLTRSGFLVADGDSFKVAEPVLRTNEDSLQAAFMQQHHSELLKTWSQNLAQLSPQEQELGVLNIPIHSSKIPELRRRIRQFQDEIVGFVQSETEADRVVQLGTYLMPFPKV